MTSNHEYIVRGFRYLLRAFGPYVCAVLRAEFGSGWWQEAVLKVLFEENLRGLPVSGTEAELVASIDIKRAIVLFDVHWNKVFRRRLPIENRSWAKELMSVRDKQAHQGLADFSEDDTWRALDTMCRLASQIDADTAEEIRSLMREARYGSAAGSMTVQPQEKPVDVGPAAALQCWREVIEPHPDVAQGRYRNAEFAADLAQVARGEGSFEYLDPVEFFARTYLTRGMKALLGEALLRVAGKGGEPVIQLKTAFGGGKTHSMLALYHLLRGRAPLAKIPSVKPLLAGAALEAAPVVHVAVLVGTALNPAQSKRPPNLPGITVHTLWGEIASQLAISAGKPELYDIVRDADKKGVSPGSVALTRLFDEAGSCLVLVDELVAYGKKLYGAREMPAGSFDNFITFIQELSEAARASKSSLVVASIPESDIEIGGESGQKTLEAIEHTFGRLEAIWKPVEASEGFEVVRRRLFLDCRDEAARDRVCAGYSAFYNENQGDFPVESREKEYLDRMIACYPIHPEVFDRLYEDWATLEHFQRTRGVLRLMAAVIHELWMSNDQSLLIQPGSLPLDAPAVRDELIRQLDKNANWSSIMDMEVDGKNSQPFKQDKSKSRYGKLAASRRLARSIMLGSAPTVAQQRVRGIETARIRLGAIQPGESISIFNDALNDLQGVLAYLYSNPSFNRFWYDTRPTLRKVVEDRALQFDSRHVELELEARLRSACKKMPPLMGVHVCPASSLDVPDEDMARLVVLGPNDPYLDNASPAIAAANDILANRGNSPRQYKNMLIFLAADKRSIAPLVAETRRYKAWQSVREDSIDLNLDAAQNRETDASLKRSSENIDMLIYEAWRWILVPGMERDNLKSAEWQLTQLTGKDDLEKNPLDRKVMPRLVKRLTYEDAIYSSWSPGPLMLEMDGLLWQGRDHLQIQTLWDYLCSYCYLPRLECYETLAKAIAKGVEDSDAWFAYAAGFDGERYIDLAWNKTVQVERSGYLVKREAARKQLEAEREIEPPTPPPASSRSVQGVEERFEQPVIPPKRFYMGAQLDYTRISRDVGEITSEILRFLADGARLDIRLEVEVTSKTGFDKETVRAVSENCKTLKIATHGFTEE